MKCSRCKEWHQRTFPCDNDGKKENICGKCIIEIWGFRDFRVLQIIIKALKKELKGDIVNE